jgi:hypothetical protein
MMFEKLRRRLAMDMAPFSKKPPAAAADAQISELAARGEAELGIVLPEPYMEFLREMNGFAWNDAIMYGCDADGERPGVDLVEQNKSWHDNEWNKRYLFLGESSISWYVFDSADGRYKLLDLPSGADMEIFDGFHDLVAALVAVAVG